jgi:hypothetical protein
MLSAPGLASLDVYERMAIDWLEWEAKNTGQLIRHQGNDKEKVIGRHRLPVDGFCKQGFGAVYSAGRMKVLSFSW